jgi:tRNA(His) 5'-end guanylyltransferase
VLLLLLLLLLLLQAVLLEFPVVLGYGESDEYSFVLNKDTTLYGARQVPEHIRTLDRGFQLYTYACILLLCKTM